MMRAGYGPVLVMLIGCKPATTEPAPTTEPPAAQSEAVEAREGKIACHLDCSGQERTAYGATEQEARTAAQQLVEGTCRPEDGQYFIVCDPPTQ